MIQIESGTTPVINVITFEYEEIPASLNYVIVDPNGKMFDKEQSWGGLSSYTEEVGMMNGFANGSTAFVKSNVYKFVGWYSDEACENLLRTNATYVPAKEDGILWEDGTTYYAKFEYNLTSLTIEKAFPSDTDYTMDPNQTFIFQITGNRVDLKVTVHGGGATTVDGLTAGETYTITEKTEWSWRYRCNGWSHGTEKGTGNVATITIGLDGTVTFTNERTNPYWFDGDSWCNNIFKAN